ncbi:MAG: STT3 domain-containing protein [Nitrososphaeria archaeon]
MSNIIKLFASKRRLSRPYIKREKVLLIYALTIIFVLAIGVRLLSAQYGFYINEFDPYFQYISTNYIVKSFDQKGFAGILDYFNWVDRMAWYPEGRDVASTSFSGLHYLGAFLYLFFRNILQINITLYDFLALLPVAIGGFISLAIYLLGKKIGGEGIGIFAGLLSTLSPPLISRDSFGWWDTEPLAYLFGILAFILFLEIIEKEKVSIKSLGAASTAGIFLGLSMTIWGGAMYFVGTLGILVLGALFFIKSYKSFFEHILVLTGFNLLISMMFKKPGYMVIINPANLVIYIGIASCFLLMLKEKGMIIGFKDKMYAILTAVMMGLTLVSFGAVGRLTQRYLSVIFPFELSQEPIVESVAEHASSTAVEYFTFFSIMIFFGGFSIYYIIKNVDFRRFSAIIFTVTALYFAASFGRLMIYLTFSLTILGSIGILAIIRTLFAQPSKFTLKRKGLEITNTNFKLVFIAFILIIMLFNCSIWIRYADQPVSLLNGSTAFKVVSNDWIDALSYIRERTPEDSVIISWWDYGYWIRVIGNRTTLVDNATLNTTKIALVGKMFLSNEEEAIQIIKELVPGRKNVYVVVFTVGQQIQQGVYWIGGGGDESKFPWMAKIARLDETMYYNESKNQPTEYFWENTLLGKMLPWTPTQAQYGNQIITVYYYHQKIGETNNPYFELVYKSPFTSYLQVLIYKAKL